MALDPTKLKALRELLHECCALLTTDGGRGSGFFIDDRHILTCAHVVGDAEHVEVRPYKRNPITGKVVACLPGDEQDLALIEVPPADSQPAVVLHNALHENQSYYAVGYPRGELVGDDGQEGIPYNGYPRRDNNDGTASLLVLGAGKSRVTPGLSGGAVLNEETGAVVGLVQYSLDTVSDAGGGSIPILRAAQCIPLVHRYLEDPPTAARRWRDALDEQAWQALGKTWGWEHSIDVYLQGNRTEWTVRLDPDDACAQVVTMQNLPCEAAEALFQWAQRGSARRKDQVKLLGTLLSGAIFPSPVMERIVSERLADDLLIRLHVDEQLCDVPWEFATVQDTHIAAERSVALVRIGAHQHEHETTTAASESARVLGIVLQPDSWHDAMPTLLEPTEVPWDEPEVMLERLQQAVPASSQLKLETLQNPKPSELKLHLSSAPSDDPFDIVHYIGYGQGDDKSAKLALSDGRGDATWQPADDIFAWVAGCGARLLIVQLLLPRSGRNPDPIRPERFEKALAHHLNAVIFTRLPVHPRQVHAFNEALYADLAHGKSVEEAVQTARWTLLTDQVLSDAAGFGWFTLLTGRKSGMKIVPEVGATKGVKQHAPREPRTRSDQPSSAATTTFERPRSR